MQKLALKSTHEGKRLPNGGRLLKAAELTHAEAQLLSNKGYKHYFKLVDPDKHPNPSERPPATSPANPATASAANDTDGTGNEIKVEAHIHRPETKRDPKPETKPEPRPIDKPTGREELDSTKEPQ